MVKAGHLKYLKFSSMFNCLIFLHHIPVFKTFDSFQLVEDFQQKAVAAGSEDAASVATLQKCEELLPGEVIIFQSDLIYSFSLIFLSLLYFGRSRSEAA